MTRWFQSHHRWGLWDQQSESNLIANLLWSSISFKGIPTVSAIIVIPVNIGKKVFSGNSIIKVMQEKCRRPTVFNSTHASSFMYCDNQMF